MGTNGKTFMFIFGTVFLALVFANLSLQAIAKKQASMASALAAASV